MRNDGVVDVRVLKILKTRRRRNGWTGSWKKGRKLGNDSIRPDEKFIVGKTRERVECMIECSVNNNERRRNAL